MITLPIDKYQYIDCVGSVIINWAKKSNVANYSAQRMEDTNFSDLNVRLGQPYLYEHQGSCQHVVVFSDIRFVCTF